MSAVMAPPASTIGVQRVDGGSRERVLPSRTRPEHTIPRWGSDDDPEPPVTQVEGTKTSAVVRPDLLPYKPRCCTDCCTSPRNSGVSAGPGLHSMPGRRTAPEAPAREPCRAVGRLNVGPHFYAVPDLYAVPATERRRARLAQGRDPWHEAATEVLSVAGRAADTPMTAE